VQLMTILMWRTDVIWINGWLIYRVFEDGCLVSELMERGGKHTIKEISDDIRRAEVVAARYGSLSKDTDGKNLYDRAEDEGGGTQKFF